MEALFKVLFPGKIIASRRFCLLRGNAMKINGVIHNDEIVSRYKHTHVKVKLEIMKRENELTVFHGNSVTCIINPFGRKKKRVKSGHKGR